MSTIVIIEDHADNARLAEKLLTKDGYNVRIAEDGETGLQLVTDVHPDLILIDLGLPDVDGQTIAALIRRRPELRTVPMVAFTAWPEDRALAMAKAYGCDGLISKPIDTRTFSQQVKHYLPAASPESTGQISTTTDEITGKP